MKGIICYKSLKGIYVKSTNDVDKAIKFKDKFYPQIFDTLGVNIKDIDIFKVYETNDEVLLNDIKNGVIYLLQQQAIALNNNTVFKPKKSIDLINEVYYRIVNDIEIPKTDNSYTAIKYNILNSIELKTNIKLNLLQATLISIIRTFGDNRYYGGFKLLAKKCFTTVDEVKQELRFLCKSNILECSKDAKGISFTLNKKYISIL
jgi:hypothetical protein